MGGKGRLRLSGLCCGSHLRTLGSNSISNQAFSVFPTQNSLDYLRSGPPASIFLHLTNPCWLCLSLSVSARTVIVPVSWWIGLLVADISELPWLVTSLQGVCVLFKWQGLTLSSASSCCWKGGGSECLQKVMRKANPQGWVHFRVRLPPQGPQGG